MKSFILPVVFLSLAASPVFSKDNKKNENHSADAIAIILKDHAHIRDMFARLDKSIRAESKNANHNSNGDSESHKLFNELKDFLVKHETMEQTAWYPGLEKNEDLKKIIAELKKEEAGAGDEIKKIEGIKDNKEWASEIKKLEKAVDHHAKDEENKLFPKVKKTVDKETLNELGQKVQEYHEKNNMSY